ncbi:hypothetical protein RV11_GL001107 [Enterococcus phoeniculicola]|nr:hypothetical protein RV11_GL001107 [Enterococcus phoeniculicola]
MKELAKIHENETREKIAKRGQKWFSLSRFFYFMNGFLFIDCLKETNDISDKTSNLNKKSLIL